MRYPSTCHAQDAETAWREMVALNAVAMLPRRKSLPVHSSIPHSSLPFLQRFLPVRGRACSHLACFTTTPLSLSLLFRAISHSLAGSLATPQRRYPHAPCPDTRRAAVGRRARPCLHHRTVTATATAPPTERRPPRGARGPCGQPRPGNSGRPRCGTRSFATGEQPTRNGHRQKGARVRSALRRGGSCRTSARAPEEGRPHTHPRGRR